jgi:RNA polymerase sigma-70 factor, ECF subfamily
MASAHLLSIVNRNAPSGVEGITRPGKSGNAAAVAVRGADGAGTVDVRWADLVARVEAGEPEAMEELYRLFYKGVRFYLCRQLGPQELDDKVHDTFLIVVQAIRRGELREPERLMGFVRTVVRRQVAAYIECAVHDRRKTAEIDADLVVTDGHRSPEETILHQERVQIMYRLLRNISRRDREVLTRFYLDEQPQDRICEEMQLTGNQFRLLKSRAKARFGQIGRKRLAKPPLSAILMRNLAASGH